MGTGRAVSGSRGLGVVVVVVVVGRLVVVTRAIGRRTAGVVKGGGRAGERGRGRGRGEEIS